MSTANKFMDWCRIPPPAPKNNHKKLFACGLICAILSVSLFAGLPLFYGTFMAGSVGTFTASATVLSVANIGQGPHYIQNATYLQIAEANDSTVLNYEEVMKQIYIDTSSGLFFGGGYYDGGNETHASLNMTVLNLGDKNLTATSIEIYRGSSLFARIDGPFFIKANSTGVVNLQIYHLSVLSDDETQLITQFRQQGECDATIFAGRVMYPVTLKTAEGVSVGYEKFMFPTDYVWSDCG